MQNKVCGNWRYGIINRGRGHVGNRCRCGYNGRWGIDRSASGRKVNTISRWCEGLTGNRKGKVHVKYLLIERRQTLGVTYSNVSAIYEYYAGNGGSNLS